MEELYQYIIIVVLLFLSGIFSSSETAFFSLSNTRKDEYILGHRKNQNASRLLKNPNYLLVTLLFGNMLVNIFLSNLTEGIISSHPYLADLSLESKMFIAIGVATMVILIFGEALPKVIAINKPTGIISLFSTVIYFISIIIHPLKKLLFYSTTFSRKIFKPREDENTITDDELSTIVNVSFKEGAIDREEVMLIQNVLKFAKQEVSSIMTPRTKMFCVDVHSSFDKFIYESKKAGYSKIPVYEDNKDNIKGIIYLRDLLSFIRYEEEKPEDLTGFIKDVLYVPEGKPLHELLRELKEQRIKAAVVIDEYGGTAGIVTLDDVIHRITGRFYEEDNEHIGRKVQKIRKSEYLCNGDASLEEVHKVTGIELSDPEQETIAGYLISRMDKIPVQGEKYNDGHFVFTVNKMDVKKIEQILIKKKHKKHKKSKKPDKKQGKN